MILALSMGDLRTFSLPVLPVFRRGFYFSDLHFRLAQQLRQLGKNCGDALRLVASEQLAPESATRLLFEIYIGKGLPVGVLHHKTAIQFLDGPGRREVALRHGELDDSPGPWTLLRLSVHAEARRDQSFSGADVISFSVSSDAGAGCAGTSLCSTGAQAIAPLAPCLAQ